MNLDSLISLLNRWDFWQRLSTTPGRVDQLEERIAALEARLNAMGDGKRLCDKCGEPGVSIEAREEPFGTDGIIVRIYRRCGECGDVDRTDGSVLKKPTAAIMTARRNDPFEDF